MIQKWSKRSFGLATALSLALASSTTVAAPQKYITYSSGTGFFVTKSGYLVTNEHVVRNCQSVEIKGERNADAQIISVDKKNDLALLKIKGFAPSIAPLRYISGSIRKGDEVVVMGYPGQAAVTGQYKYVTAQVIDTKGPQGEKNWLQFTDAAQKGNSGGPLLDRSGNVIGVVTGKTELYTIDRRTGEKKVLKRADVAVTLPILRRFLSKHYVHPRTGNTLIEHGDNYLQKRADDYIVNVRCITGYRYAGS